jgi:hypothetical protein
VSKPHSPAGFDPLETPFRAGQTPAVFATDALTVRGLDGELPEVACYVERGPGAAIRQARTRLPGRGPQSGRDREGAA